MLTTPERLALLETLRKACAVGCQPRASADQPDRAAEPTPPNWAANWRPALANRLRISRGEGSRRIHEAEDLGRAHGDELASRCRRCWRRPPQRSARASWVRTCRGDSRLLHRLPDFVDVETRAKAEAQLARLGGEHRPDELAKLADKLLDCLNPDGDFTDVDRAKRRGITIGKPGVDGMTPISGYLTPEARATVDAVFAKLAAPGMCNPADAEPMRAAAPRPGRHPGRQPQRRPTQPRRPHSWQAAPLLASGEFGQHNGLPASIIVTTTLQELEAGAGRGLTGGGTLLPMSDVIRLGSPRPSLPGDLRQRQSPGALSHQTSGLASPTNCALHAKDRGCSFPGCTVPGYLCEVHHNDPYAKSHTTDVNDMTLACSPNHKLADQGWTTRTNQHGDTEWIPPAHLDHGQPRINTLPPPRKAATRQRRRRSRRQAPRRPSPQRCHDSR